MYGRACDHCGRLYRSTTRMGAFTLRAWHMRMVHYPDWGQST
jgi:hypothetical protein